MREIKVSVIVPVFNGIDYVEPFLRSISTQSESKHVEVIIVDNSSVDGTLDLLKSFSKHFSNLRLYEELRTQSSYAARNTGIKHATGKFLAFTDIDCQPDPFWIERCLFHACNENLHSLVSGPIDMFSQENHANIYELYDMHGFLQQETYAKSGYGATANLLVPRKVFKEVGYFKNVISGGDQEFCRRAVKSGFNFIFDENMRVRHPARSTLEDHKKKAARVGKGLAQNFYALRKSDMQRLLYIYRQIIGILIPRNQFVIVNKIISKHSELSLLERCQLISVAIYFGNLQRWSILKNLYRN